VVNAGKVKSCKNRYYMHKNWGFAFWQWNPCGFTV